MGASQRGLTAASAFAAGNTASTSVSSPSRSPVRVTTATSTRSNRAGHHRPARLFGFPSQDSHGSRGSESVAGARSRSRGESLDSDGPGGGSGGDQDEERRGNAAGSGDEDGHGHEDSGSSFCGCTSTEEHSTSACTGFAPGLSRNQRDAAATAAGDYALLGAQAALAHAQEQLREAVRRAELAEADAAAARAAAASADNEAADAKRQADAWHAEARRRQAEAEEQQSQRQALVDAAQDAAEARQRAEATAAEAEAAAAEMGRELLEARRKLAAVAARAEGLLLQGETLGERLKSAEAKLSEARGKEAAALVTAANEAEAAATARAARDAALAATAAARDEAAAVRKQSKAAAAEHKAATEQQRAEHAAAMQAATDAHATELAALEAARAAAVKCAETAQAAAAAASERVAAVAGERLKAEAALTSKIAAQRTRAEAAELSAATATAATAEASARASAAETACRKAQAALLSMESRALAVEGELATVRAAAGELRRVADAARARAASLANDLKAALQRNRRLNGICPKCSAALMPVQAEVVAESSPPSQAETANSPALRSPTMLLPEPLTAAAALTGAYGASPAAAAAPSSAAGKVQTSSHTPSPVVVGLVQPHLLRTATAVAAGRRVAAFLRCVTSRRRAEEADGSFARAAASWSGRLRSEEPHSQHRRHGHASGEGLVAVTYSGRASLASSVGASISAVLLSSPQTLSAPLRVAGAAAVPYAADAGASGVTVSHRSESQSARPPFRATSPSPGPSPLPPATSPAMAGLGVLQHSRNGSGSAAYLMSGPCPTPAAAASGMEHLLQAEAATLRSELPVSRLRAAVGASFTALAAGREERHALGRRVEDLQEALQAARTRLRALHRDAKVAAQQRDTALAAAQVLQRVGITLWRGQLRTVRALADQLASAGLAGDVLIEDGALALPAEFSTPLRQWTGLGTAVKQAARADPLAAVSVTAGHTATTTVPGLRLSAAATRRSASASPSVPTAATAPRARAAAAVTAMPTAAQGLATADGCVSMFAADHDDDGDDGRDVGDHFDVGRHEGHGSSDDAYEYGSGSESESPADHDHHAMPPWDHDATASQFDAGEADAVALNPVGAAAAAVAQQPDGAHPAQTGGPVSEPVDHDDMPVGRPTIFPIHMHRQLQHSLMLSEQSEALSAAAARGPDVDVSVLPASAQSLQLSGLLDNHDGAAAALSVPESESPLALMALATPMEQPEAVASEMKLALMPVGTGATASAAEHMEQLAAISAIRGGDAASASSGSLTSTTGNAIAPPSPPARPCVTATALLARARGRLATASSTRSGQSSQSIIIPAPGPLSLGLHDSEADTTVTRVPVARIADSASTLQAFAAMPAVPLLPLPLQLPGRAFNHDAGSGSSDAAAPAAGESAGASSGALLAPLSTAVVMAQQPLSARSRVEAAVVRQPLPQAPGSARSVSRGRLDVEPAVATIHLRAASPPPGASGRAGATSPIPSLSPPSAGIAATGSTATIGQAAGLRVSSTPGNGAPVVLPAQPAPPPSPFINASAVASHLHDPSTLHGDYGY